MTNTKRWIWHQTHYPHFTYDKSKLEATLLEIKYQQGLLDGIYKNINKSDLDVAKVEILTTEAVDTSAIEGEVLSRSRRPRWECIHKVVLFELTPL